MPVRITTRGLDRSPGLSPRTVRRRAEAMLSELGRHADELSIMLCDDATIAELNQSYRGKVGPTDVLSFPQTNGESGEGCKKPDPEREAGQPLLLGDIVISLPMAAKQAKGARHGLRREVTVLLAHGLLHLLGWDHGSDSLRQAMDREMERLIRAAKPHSRTLH